MSCSAEKRLKFNPTSLHDALRSLDFEQVDELLKNGADVNEVEPNSCNTPLHLAIKYKASIKIVRQLLESGADVNKKDFNGLTPLYYAILYKASLETIQELLKSGANVNMQVYEHTPIGGAKDIDDAINSLQYELDEGIKQEHVPDYNPLCYAILHKASLEVVKELLKYGAEADMLNIYNRTPIFYAIELGASLEIVQELLKFGADVTTQDRNLDSPLHYAIKFGTSSNILREMLKCADHIDVKNVNGVSALFECFFPSDTITAIPEYVTCNECPEKRSYVLNSHINEDNHVGEASSCSLNTDSVEELLDYGASFHQCGDEFSYVTDQFGKLEKAREMLIKYSLLEQHIDEESEEYCYFCQELSCAFKTLIGDYKSEIEQMKNQSVINNITLYDFLVRKHDYGMLFSKENDIISKSDGSLNRLCLKYPKYCDVILRRLATRTYLLKKLDDVSFSVQIKDKIIRIPYTLRKMGKYLSNADMKNLIRAYSDNNPFSVQ